MLQSKICSLGGHEKPLEAFGKRSRSPDGYNASCRECRSARRKTYQSEVDHRKKYYREHKEERLASVAAWYANNPGKKAAHRKVYRKNNLQKIREAERNKFIERRTRVPRWLTEEQKKQINAIYRFRDDLAAETFMDYHVYHIVPLKGENVCGLHVPWNLEVIPAFENLSKWNRFEQGFSANTGGLPQ